MRRWLAGAAPLALVGAAFACGADQTSSSFGPNGGDAAADSGGTEDGGLAVATGVVLAHAAAFPSFRLCFENYPDLPPLPNDDVMPESNVVGVAMGGFVRIPPLPKAPGEVWIIDRRKATATPADPLDRSCGALRKDTDAFRRNLDYQIAGRIDEPLGVDRVHLLAITGCGGAAWIDALGVPRSACKNWDQTAGSLHAVTLPLAAGTTPARGELPVQLIHLASLIEGKAIAITFGSLDAGRTAPLANVVATSPPLFDAGPTTSLHLDQTSEAVYGAYGFRIALGLTDDAGLADGGLVVDETLASLQELSLSTSEPTTYFAAASSYALLLLGDPQFLQTFDDGGANPAFDARRGVHLVAVPLRGTVDDGGFR